METTDNQANATGATPISTPQPSTPQAATTTTETGTHPATFSSGIRITSSVQYGSGFAAPFILKGNGIPTYSSSFFPGLGSNTLRVQAGSVFKDLAIPNLKLASDTLTATVLEGTVYHDDPVVRIAVQARDPLFNVPAVWRPVIVTAAPTAALAAVNANKAVGTCTVPQQKGHRVGLCIIEVRLYDEWFMDFNSTALAGQSVEIAVSFSDGDGAGGGRQSSAAAVTQLGSVQLHPRKTVLLGNNIVAYLPSHPVRPGDTFTVPVYAAFERLLETFTLDFQVLGGLTMLDFTLKPAGGWSGTTANTGDIATLAYIRDAANLDKEGGQPQELLLHMVVRAPSDAAIPLSSDDSTSAVHVRWNDTSNVLGDAVAPDAPSLVIDRESAGNTGFGRVFLRRDKMRGLFAAADQATLINTAVVGGPPVSSSVLVKAVHESGAVTSVASDSLDCDGPTRAGQQVVEATCAKIVVREQHTVGSARAFVLFAHRSHRGMVAAMPVAVWVPRLPVQLTIAINPLRKVEGWWKDGCDRHSFLYQRSSVAASATFWQGAEAFNGVVFEADVTSLIRQKLTFANGTSSGSPPSSAGLPIAELTRAGEVHGLVPGVTSLQAIDSAGGIIASTKVTVLDDSVLAVGLDVALVKELRPHLVSRATSNDLNNDPLRASFADVELKVDVNRGPLTFEGDQTHLIASAVFADGTRMPLTEDLGLKFYSTSNRSITVRTDSTTGASMALVPYMAESASGMLIGATWESPAVSPASCGWDVRLPSPDSLASRVVARGFGNVSVALPRALRAVVTVTTSSRSNPQFLVHPGGVAADAGLPSVATIAVHLEYPARTVDVTSDPRTEYDLSEASGMLTVNPSTGLISVDPRSPAGTGTIVVRFAHEDVVADVVLGVADVELLAVRTSPEPAYARPIDSSIHTLSLIGGSSPPLYENARLALEMILTNGHSVTLRPDQCLFTLADASGAESAVATVEDAVVVPVAPGTVYISGQFGATRSQASLLMTILSAPVHVVRIDSVHVNQDGRVLDADTYALKGKSGEAQGQTDVSVTLSNGRRFMSLFDGSGLPLIPGLVAFDTTTPTAVSVDPTSGRVTLLENVAGSAAVFALIETAERNKPNLLKQTTFACNLEPTTVGDIDLGSRDGPPLKDAAVGDVIEVPLRVNVGDNTLGTFDIFITFDSAVLQAHKSPVIFNSNKKLVGSGILDVIIAENSLHFSGSIDTATFTGREALLVTLKFTAIKEGVSPIGGIVGLIGSTSIPPLDIAKRGSSFVAGIVYQTVVDGGGRRTRRVRKQSVGPAAAAQPVGHAAAAQPVGHAAAARLQQRIIIAALRTRRQGSSADAAAVQDPNACTHETGDTNADCKFDVNDVRFVTQYLAYRGIGFKGDNGPAVKHILDVFPHTQSALDADHSGEVTSKDASFLNKVNLGIFVFVQQVAVHKDGCLTRVDLRLLEKGDRPVPLERVRIFFDFARDGAFKEEFQRLQVGVGTMIVPTPESSQLTQGNLIQAECTRDTGSTTCAVVFSGAIAGSNPEQPSEVGLSVLQLVHQPGGDVEFKFMAGIERGPFSVSENVQATIPTFGTRVDVRSSGSAGYNPMRTFEANVLRCGSTQPSSTVSPAVTDAASSTMDVAESTEAATTTAVGETVPIGSATATATSPINATTRSRDQTSESETTVTILPITTSLAGATTSAHETDANGSTESNGFASATTASETPEPLPSTTQSQAATTSGSESTSAAGGPTPAVSSKTARAPIVSDATLTYTVTTRTKTLPLRVCPGGTAGYRYANNTRHSTVQGRIDRVGNLDSEACARRCSEDTSCVFFTHSERDRVCHYFSAVPETHQDNTFAAYIRLASCTTATTATVTVRTDTSSTSTSTSTTHSTDTITSTSHSTGTDTSTSSTSAPLSQLGTATAATTVIGPNGTGPNIKIVFFFFVEGLTRAVSPTVQLALVTGMIRSFGLDPGLYVLWTWQTGDDENSFDQLVASATGFPGDIAVLQAAVKEGSFQLFIDGKGYVPQPYSQDMDDKSDPTTVTSIAATDTQQGGDLVVNSNIEASGGSNNSSQLPGYAVALVICAWVILIAFVGLAAYHKLKPDPSHSTKPDAGSLDLSLYDVGKSDRARDERAAMLNDHRQRLSNLAVDNHLDSRSSSFNNKRSAALQRNPHHTLAGKAIPGLAKRSSSYDMLPPRPRSNARNHPKASPGPYLPRGRGQGPRPQFASPSKSVRSVDLRHFAPSNASIPARRREPRFTGMGAVEEERSWSPDSILPSELGMSAPSSESGSYGACSDDTRGEWRLYHANSASRDSMFPTQQSGHNMSPDMSTFSPDSVRYTPIRDLGAGRGLPGAAGVTADHASAQRLVPSDGGYINLNSAQSDGGYIVLGSPSDSDQRMDTTSTSFGVKSADSSHADGSGQHVELWDEPPTSLLPNDRLKFYGAPPDSTGWVSPTEPSMYGL
jgi:hypothetical protein